MGGKNKKYPPFKRRPASGANSATPTPATKANGGDSAAPKTNQFPSSPPPAHHHPASHQQGVKSPPSQPANQNSKKSNFLSSIKPPQGNTKKHKHKQRGAMGAALSCEDLDEMGERQPSGGVPTTPTPKQQQRGAKKNGGSGPKFSFVPSSPAKTPTPADKQHANGGHRRSLKFVVSSTITDNGGAGSSSPSVIPGKGARFGHGRRSHRGGGSTGSTATASLGRHHSEGRATSVASKPDETPAFANAASKQPLIGMSITLPENAQPAPAKFSFTKTAAATTSDSSTNRSTSPQQSAVPSHHEDPNTSATTGQQKPATPSLSFQFHPSMVGQQQPQREGSPESPNERLSAAGGAMPFLDLGASAARAGEWLCQACGNGKIFTGKKYASKTWIRADCQVCGKKRTFVKHSAGGSVEYPTTGGGSVGGYDHSSMGEQLGSQQDLLAALAAGADPPIATTHITVWVCEVCRKEKDLSGPHLDGKDRVRSDCWPCAKKRSFLRILKEVELSPVAATVGGGSFARAVNIGVPQTPPLAPASNPSFPATTVDSQSKGFASEPTAPPPFAGAAAKATPSIVARKADPDACDLCGHWDIFQFFKHVMQLRSTLLQVRSGTHPQACHASSLAKKSTDRDEEHPLAHLFAPPLSALSNDGGGIRVFFGADGAIYAMRHDLRYFVKDATTGEFVLDECKKSTTRNNASKSGGLEGSTAAHHQIRAVTTEHLALLTQIAIQAETLASTRSKRINAVYCNNSVTFAAIALYFSTLGESDTAAKVSVFGPAPDPTVKHGKLENLAMCNNGKGIMVSVEAKMAAVKRVHRQSGFVVTPNGATGAAIRHLVEQQQQHQGGSSSMGNQTDCVPLVVLGKVAPWSDDDSPISSPSL